MPVPPLLGGAIEKFFYAMGPVWAAKGHRVYHISRQYGDLPQAEEINGVYHRRYCSKDSSGNMIVDKFRDFCYTDRVVRDLPPSDVIVSNTFFLPLLAGKHASRLFVHAARFPKGQLALYSKAGLVQFPSAAVLEAARVQAPQLEDIYCVLPYALPSNPLENLPAAKTEVPEALKQLLYVGRVHPEKGVDLLLESLLLIPEDIQTGLHLRVVGPVDESAGGGGQRYMDKLTALAKRSKATIDFVGPVFDADKLAKIYESADLFIYPSLADKGETFGVAALEALANATPSLVSDLDCFKDFIKEGKNGFIFDHHADAPDAALAQKLIEAFAQAPRWPQLCQNSLDTAAEFTLDKIADQFLEKFEEIAQRHD